MVIGGLTILALFVLLICYRYRKPPNCPPGFLPAFDIANFPPPNCSEGQKREWRRKHREKHINLEFSVRGYQPKTDNCSSTPPTGGSGVPDLKR